MLRKLLSLTLTIALLATFCTFPVSAASPSIGVHSVGTFDSVKATTFVADSNVKIIGRNNPANPLLFAWHASGIEFDVTGTSVVGVRLKDYVKYNSTAVPLVVTINGEHVTLDGSDNTEIYDYNESNQTWLSNNPQSAKNCFEVPDDGGQNDYIFATNLDPDKTYTVKVTMDIENWAQYQYYAFWAVSALTDNSSSAKVSKTADADNKILVLGDSITSARNIGGIHNSYHQLTAQAFNADTQVVSAGGAIFTRKYLHIDEKGGNTTDYVVNETSTTMLNKMSIVDAYNKTAWYGKYSYIPELEDSNNDGNLDIYCTTENPRFTPDLVIINIGTNDAGYLRNTTATPSAYSKNGTYATIGDYNKNVFKTDFVALLDDLREMYNNPTVILCYGMMSRYTDIMSFYDSIVAEYNTANSGAKVSTFFFDGFDVSSAGKLDDGHPDKYAHKAASKLLIPEVEEVMGWQNTTGEYYPKVYNFVKTNGNTLINSHASNVPYTLPDAEYYVGDTIKFSDTFFKDNSFTYYYNNTTYDLTGVWVYVYKYGEKTEKIQLKSPEVAVIDTTYTFDSVGTYIIASCNTYYDNGSVNNKYITWDRTNRLAVIEVKDPSTIKEVKVPTTDQTTGTKISISSAVVEYMSYSASSSSHLTDTQVKKASILGSSTFSVNASAPAGTILDVLFTFREVSYVKTVSWTATSNEMFTGADIYGSENGTDWYLLQDECNVTKSGTTYTFTVNGVAKYIKVKNFNFTSNGVSEGMTSASATGFTLSSGEDDGDDPFAPTVGAKATTYIYPEYPEYSETGDVLLPRDYDYEVYVNDGTRDVQIPVYNASRNKSTFEKYSDGTPDQFRRFCEFSFEGEVTIKIKVKGAMSNFAVLPANSLSASNTSYDSSTGIISIKITEPKNLIIRLNDDDKTNLSIFAERLWTEDEIPTGSNVRVLEAGYHDMVANGNGAYVSNGNEEWYLMPGALVGTRFKVEYGKSNVTISGRGSFLDPRTDRNNHDLTNFFFANNCTNVVLKDVKFLDAHCFNICFTTTELEIDGIKILSSEISTDGITFWGDCVGTVRNVFLYVNDNAFVVGGSGKGSLDIYDTIVGNYHAIIYLQGTQTHLVFDGMDVFRMQNLLAARQDMRSTNPTWSGVLIKNVRTEEVLATTDIVFTQYQGSGTKAITFENLALNHNGKNIQSWDDSSSTSTNFEFTFKNVFVNGTKVTSTSGLTFENVTVGKGNYNCTFSNSSSVTVDSIYNVNRFSKVKKTASHTAEPTFIVGESFKTPYYKFLSKTESNGLVYVPVAYVLERSGYATKVLNDGKTVSATRNEITITLNETSASNTTLSELPKMIDGVLCAPLSLFNEVYGIKVGLDASKNVLVAAGLSGNLLKDGGFEDIAHTGNMLKYDTTRHYATSPYWLDFYFGHIYRETTNVRSGESAMRIGTRADQRGVAQNVGEIFKTYGAGTYTFTAYVKLGANATSNAIIKSGLSLVGYDPNASGSAMTAYTYDQLSTTSWTKLTRTVTVTDEMVAKADTYLFCVVGRDTSVPKTDDAQDGFYYYVDDASVTFTPTTENTKVAEIAPYVTSGERTLYYKYDGSSFVLDTAKTPSGTTVNLGDRIDISEALMQKYPDIDLNRVTLKATYSTGFWAQAPLVDGIYAADSGTLTLAISKYYKVDGTAVTVSETLLDLTVSSSYGDSNSDLSTYTYTDITENNAIIQGRTTSSTPDVFYWQGSGAEFNFTGTTIGIKVKTQATQKIIYQIDGGKEQTLIVKGLKANKAYTYILAENLANTNHTIKILRNDETFWGQIEISAVTDKNKTISKPQAEEKLNIQFIGDSITSGNSLENYTQSYVYVASKLLNANFQAFSISGAVMSDFKTDDGTRKSANSGAVMPYLYGNGASISQTRSSGYQFNESTYTGTLVSGSYSKNSYVPSTATYDMSKFTPDIVVINLGTNDANSFASSATYKDSNKETFVNMYANFLMKLSEYYPEAKFVLSYGMMWAQQHVVNAINETLELYREKGGTNEATVLTFTTSSDRAYDAAHPGPVGHTTAANELIKAIEDMELSGTTTFTADAQGNVTLPELTQKEGALLKGWYDENGNVFEAGTQLEPNAKIKLTPVYMDTKDALASKVNPDGISAEPFSGDSAIGSDAEFTNGMYYQGIQIRKTSPTGLRFVFARGFELERLIKGEIPNTSFEVRYLVALKSNLKGKELTVDTAALKGVAENIYRTSEELSVDGQEAEDYNKFTVCVTGLNAEAYINTVICVRPYITYTDASGQEHILYGEQASCSLYEGAKGVYDGSTNAEDKEWLYENILSLAYGDNDEDAGNIFQ